MLQVVKGQNTHDRSGDATLGTPAVAVDSAKAARRSAMYRRPWRRLLRAYRVTLQVVLSYWFLRMRRRFRSEEAAAELVQAVHRENARRVLATIVELQGLFIKVGQLISVLANMLPEAFRKELQTLQDRVPPRPYEDIEARLVEELGGRPPSQVFGEFDRNPVASASIGQVHVARLHSGEKVAVKVQYPGIETIVATDLGAIRRIFALLRRVLPDWGWDTIYREIREMVLAELDYQHEAGAIRAIAANFTKRKDVAIPRVIDEFSTARVLTTEWMTGIRVCDIETLDAAGVDRKQAAQLCVEAYCKQIFVDGVYHADPHPGNLLLRPPGPGESGPTVVFLDFGATARVSQGMRKGIVTFLQGAMTRDVGRIVTSLKEMGFLARHADHEVFDRVVQHFYEHFRAQMRFEGFSLSNLKIDPRAQLATLLDLRDLNVSLRDLTDAFVVPKEWVLLERTLLLLLGVCTTLDPAMDPSAVIQPYVDRFLLGEKKEWSEAMLDTLRESALSAFALPGELGRFLTLASRGDVEVRVRGIEAGIDVMYVLGQQLLWGFLGATAYTLSVVFEGRGQEGARLVSAGVATIFGGLLLISLLRGRRLRKRRRR
jgi:predicted unusual protein kinase regulating ubiquinone biosynthesis (AarF/ABC1/UbiB family)